MWKDRFPVVVYLKKGPLLEDGDVDVEVAVDGACAVRLAVDAGRWRPQVAARRVQLVQRRVLAEARRQLVLELLDGGDVVAWRQILWRRHAADEAVAQFFRHLEVHLRFLSQSSSSAQ